MAHCICVGDIVEIHTLCHREHYSSHRHASRPWIRIWPGLPVSPPPRPTPSTEHPLHRGHAHLWELLPWARCSLQFLWYRQDACPNCFFSHHRRVGKETLLDQPRALFRELQALPFRELHRSPQRGALCLSFNKGGSFFRVFAGPPPAMNLRLFAPIS
jgi:hypothetical protein